MDKHAKKPKQQKQSSFDILKPLKKLSKRFHLTFFFVFIVACLMGAVLLINRAIQDTSDPTYTSSINAGSIDKATLNRLDTLHTSAQGAPAPVLPAGRINPVGE